MQVENFRECTNFAVYSTVYLNIVFKESAHIWPVYMHISITWPDHCLFLYMNNLDRNLTTAFSASTSTTSDNSLL